MKKKITIWIDMENVVGLKTLSEGRREVSWRINEAIKDYIRKELASK